jgi:hypothetical protein
MSIPVCITVIDESLPDTTERRATIRNDWLNFRQTFPNRTFWLLLPGNRPGSDLLVPQEYFNDPKANGPINVSRDGGNVSSRSDWFAICNLAGLPVGSGISLAIDTSGSMRFETVSASYDLFVQKCAQAGYIVVLDDRFPDERWAPPHFIYLPPNATFSVNPTEIVRGNNATLSWNVTGEAISSISINQGIGNVAPSGTRSVSPQNTITYTLTVSNPSATITRSVTLTVYVPPVVTFSLDSSSIIRGQCTTLRWVTTGDASSATIDQGIGSVNINGNRQVCPTQTTTYTINVTGLGGSDSDTITLIVYQPPTVNLTGPVSLDYGKQGTLSYNATFADISLRITPTYNYRGSSVIGTVVNLPTGASVSGTVTTQIPYNDFGPFSVTYVIVATGNGGQETKQITVPIKIDETPDNFLVPESEDLFKDQAPIVTADATITSYQMLINGIDIPVEIKADKPILVDKNSQQNWKRIRRIQ